MSSALHGCFPCRCRSKDLTEPLSDCWAGFYTWLGMRIRSDSSVPERLRLNFLSEQRGRWLQRLLKRGSGRQASASVNSASPTSDEAQSLSDEEPENVTPTFEKHLEELRLFEASQLLIEREELLFQKIMEVEALEAHKEEVDQLSADYNEFKEVVVQILQQSLSVSLGVSSDTLKSAVDALYQEEERDQVWKQRGQTPPAWRPGNWKELHDATLSDLVKDRMDNPPTPPADQASQSSLQVDVNSMGRQLKEDLLWVVDVVKLSYPAHIDICNVYARMYHQIFSARLTKIADFGLEDRDCTFLLRWVHEYYPEILQKQELASEVHAESLGKLLSEELLEPLEEQYLNNRQAEVMTYIGRVLELAEQRWNGGESPKMEDGCYISPVAYDIIQVINGMVTSSGKVVGGLHKAQIITSHLTDLMERYRSFQDNIMKQSRPNSRAYIKANMASVRQFSDFLLEKSDLFPADVQGECLNILSEMKKSAHTYLLSPVHENLRPHYRKLGTYEWLKRSVFENLLVSIEAELEDLQGLTEPCQQELIGQFHQEVTTEYVKRLMKGQIKLKDREQQVQAHITVKDNAKHLDHLFSRMGSKEEWLKDILIKIAELLKLQDLPAIQVQIITMGSAFPDLSEKHVSALLKLKTNFTRADRKIVKETLSDMLVAHSNVENTQLFFSNVQVK
ncbi:tumor necrosis factor alpha-induced protein 2-like isoform X2 [Channa argus]|uniref:tumor necrosis factor alpha-induced protein 2-like isoform X2 n=1 Tax=Channa argus TaxID=215402 RepID=UPI003522F17F